MFWVGGFLCHPWNAPCGMKYLINLMHIDMASFFEESLLHDKNLVKGYEQRLLASTMLLQMKYKLDG